MDVVPQKQGSRYYTQLLANGKQEGTVWWKCAI